MGGNSPKSLWREAPRPRRGDGAILIEFSQPFGNIGAMAERRITNDPFHIARMKINCAIDRARRVQNFQQNGGKP